MHFLRAITVGAFAFAHLAVAQTKLAFSNVPTQVNAGQPTTIQYTAQDLSQPATIILRKGDPANLETISVLISNAVNGSYTWIPAKSLANATDYALEITQGDQVNYSSQFSLTGADPAAVSSAMAASSSTLAAASSLTASAISSIQSIIASYNSSLTNLTSPVTIATAPNSNATIPAASLGTGSSIPRNTTLVSPTLSSSSSSASISPPRSSSAAAAGTTTSSRARSSSATSTSASASASSTGAGATLAQAGTPALALFIVAAIFFYQ